MDIYQQTINSLQNLGYSAFLRKLEGKYYIFAGIPDKITLMKPNQSFNIFIKSKYKIEYFVGQLKVDNEFKSNEDLIGFIEEVFPITNFKPK